jgi:hypothetical protein
MTDARGQILEVGIRTRRRPIRQDYAAAKDAEVGIKKHGAEGRGQRTEG